MAGWRFLNTGAAGAARNMAIDEAIFEACRRRLVPPTVRLYGWSPPAVSLGYAQTLERELDVRRCARYGVAIVRRHTGGRAVLHDEELTYSLVAPEDHPDVGASGYDHYRIASEALIAALRELGVAARLVRNRNPAPERPDGACFTHAARYEVVHCGRKLAGSAQRRAGGVILQHGALLLGPGHTRLPLLLPHARYEYGRRLMVELAERTISLAEILGRAVSFDEMAIRVRRGFEQRLGTPFQASELIDTERRETERLITEKYGTDGWNAQRILGRPA